MILRKNGEKNATRKQKMKRLRERQYYLKAKEKRLANSKRYYERAKPEYIRKVARWRKSHPRKVRQYWRKYNEEHREENRARGRAWTQQIKRQVLSHYSPELKCVRCGFTDIRALCIDHIKGGGLALGRTIGDLRGGKNFYKWLRDKNYPEGFQVLCMNCNFIKRYENNECPGPHRQVI